jgi:hypothetical protein
MLQKTIGETASRRSDVEAYCVLSVDVEFLERAFEFKPCAARVLLLLARNFDFRVCPNRAAGLHRPLAIHANASRHEERLRLSLRICEPAFDENQIEPRF